MTLQRHAFSSQTGPNWLNLDVVFENTKHLVIERECRKGSWHFLWYFLGLFLSRKTPFVSQFYGAIFSNSQGISGEVGYLWDKGLQKSTLEHETHKGSSTSSGFCLYLEEISLEKNLPFPAHAFLSTFSWKYAINCRRFAHISANYY